MTPIFIIGNPKSGTSLLMALLDGHPELVSIAEETDYYPVMRQLKYRSAEEFCKNLLKNTHLKNLAKGENDADIGGNFNYADFDSDYFQTLLVDRLSLFDDPTEDGEALRAIVDAYHVVSSAKMMYSEPKYWLEKTPKHTYYVRSILRDFPQARFIFSIRDPRDNYLSYKKKHKQLSIERFANMWKQALQVYQGVLDVYGSDKIILIKHEDLVSHPQREIDRLTEDLGIDMASVLLKPSKFGVAWKGNSMFDKKFDSISSSTLGRYRESDQTEDLSYLEQILLDEIDNLGYDRFFIEKTTESSTSSWQRFKLWKDRISHMEPQKIEVRS